jgi:hypothetical protein
MLTPSQSGSQVQASDATAMSCAKYGVPAIYSEESKCRVASRDQEGAGAYRLILSYGLDVDTYQTTMVSKPENKKLTLSMSYPVRCGCRA